jgi:hypothetical protein
VLAHHAWLAACAIGALLSDILEPSSTADDFEPLGDVLFVIAWFLGEALIGPLALIATIVLVIGALSAGARILPVLTCASWVFVPVGMAVLYAAVADTPS